MWRRQEETQRQWYYERISFSRPAEQGTEKKLGKEVKRRGERKRGEERTEGGKLRAAHSAQVWKEKWKTLGL